MAFPVTLNGRTYTLADFEGTNYVDGLPDAFEDFVTHAGSIYKTTSTTSNTIGTGSKSFTTADNSLPYQVGTPLRISDGAAPATNWMDGIVTAYSGTSLTVNVVSYAGSGTLTDWDINIGGGGTSYTGTLPIAQGGTGATTAGAAATNLGLGTGDSPTFTGLSVDGGTIKLDGNYPVGTGNVALGDAALDSNVSGGSNTAIGADALTANTASNNTAVGYQAGYSNTIGTANVLVGATTGYSITTPPGNVAMGNAALYATTTGEYNSVLGHVALYDNTTGSYNVAIGRSALQSNTTANNNTAVGYQAGFSNTTSGDNTFVGWQAGYSRTGSGNTIVGQYAGRDGTTGTDNTLIGRNAGYTITTGSKNSILGTFNGNQNGLDIRTLSNQIVLSDGDGNARARCLANGTFIFRPSASATSGNLSSEALGVDALGVIANGFAARVNSTAYYTFMGQNPSNVNTFRVYGDGNVQNTNNSYGAISDQKVKENISDAGSQWDDIKAIRVRKYSLIMDELDHANQIGVIAQEVEASGMGGLVQTDTDRDENMNDLGTVTKSIKYSVLYMKAVKALQEAMERIETLEAKVAALEAN